MESNENNKTEEAFNKALTKLTTEELNQLKSYVEDQEYQKIKSKLFPDVELDPNLAWNHFLDFCIDHFQETKPQFQITCKSIQSVSHTKAETIIKIVLIETDKYFCCALISKYGSVGLYDGHMNFLTSYQSIMSRIDISRSEFERRRRNRWITDAFFCKELQFLFITNSTRSLVVYEASGLKHSILYFILGFPHIIQAMDYTFDNNPKQTLKLFLGLSSGSLISVQFLKPKLNLLRNKRNQKIVLYYWTELFNETSYISIKSFGKIHKHPIEHIEYCSNDILITCSKDPQVSVSSIHVSKKRPSYKFKMPLGANIFILSKKEKILITGSDDGTIRIWNTVTTSKPITILKEHKAAITDLQVLELKELFISSSGDAVLKVWHLHDHICLQTVKIDFPSFHILGKEIEWGKRSIYPGPKRSPELTNQEFKLGNQFDTMQPAKSSSIKDQDPWNRNEILLTCCNYFAKITLPNQELELEKILPPPPLLNSVLVPMEWIDNSDINLKPTEVEDLERIEKLDFILNKDLLGPDKETINYKIAGLEEEKLKMKKWVEMGAPYLALKIYDPPEIQLPDKVPPPYDQTLLDNLTVIRQLLKVSIEKDRIFSESSSGRSSRSSVYEFPL